MRAALIIGCVALVLTATTSAQRAPAAAPGRAPQTAALPPMSMTCPMHPDVIEARAGSCPLCRMALVPVRLDSAHMCPVHPAITQAAPGTCRLCGRDLVRVTVSLGWTCRGDRVEHLEPGRCDDGSPRIEKRTLRPHGNHNPKHGGQFFMAPDNWHHLEGTYPRDRVFRLYVYDDYARPLPAADLQRVRARLVTSETFDPATRVTTEIKAYPLRPARNGAYLEARIDPVTLPREMTAKVRVKDGTPEYRFDFTFSELTREPPSPAAATAARGPAPATAAVPRTGPAPAPARAATPLLPAAEADAVPDPLEARPIPATAAEILVDLRTRTRQVRDLIEAGNFTAVYVPAFHARDLAIALESHLDALPRARREAAVPALERVVRTAWLLDAFGDVGNRLQLGDSFAAFEAAIGDVVAAFQVG